MPAKWTNGTRNAADLKPYDKNPKRHPAEQIEKIAASIREFGFGPPCIIDDKNMLLAGHGRIEAVKLPGMEKFAKAVPVRIGAGLTKDQKRAYVIVDNRLTELGDWDQSILRGELHALDASGFDVGLSGFDIRDFAEPAEADAEEAPEPPKNPATRAGDVWLLGAHRVACGDSTSADDVARLLAGAKPNLMVTDPPYGVAYDPTWRHAAGVNTSSRVGKVKNDERADWGAAWALFPGSIAYVWHGALHAATVAESLERERFTIRSQIIWAKERLVIGRGDSHWQRGPQGRQLDR